MTLPKLSDYTSGRLSPKELLARHGEQRVSPGGGRQTVVLPAPPSANAYWRSVVIKGKVRVLVSKEGRAYKAAVAQITVGAVSPPLQGSVAWCVTWRRSKRMGDLSNRIKALEDALIGIAWADDKQIVELHAYRTDGGDDTVTVSWWAA